MTKYLSIFVSIQLYWIENANKIGYLRYNNNKDRFVTNNIREVEHGYSIL